MTEKLKDEPSKFMTPHELSVKIRDVLDEDPDLDIVDAMIEIAEKLNVEYESLTPILSADDVLSLKKAFVERRMLKSAAMLDL